MLNYLFLTFLVVTGGILLTFIFLKLPELGVALLLVATPAMTSLLELVIGDLPVKTLMIHVFFGVIFLGFLIKKRKVTGWFNPILFGSLLLGVWLFIGITYSPEPTYSHFKARRYFLENVYMILPAVVFYKSTWRVERFLNYVVFLGWLLCFYSLVWVAMGNLGNERLAPGSYEVIPFGRILALTILAAVALYYLKRQKGVHRPALLLYLLVAFPLLIAAVTRGALLSLLLAIFVLMMLQGGARYLLTRMSRFLFILALLITFLFLMVPILPDFARIRLIPGSDGWGSFGLRQIQLERSAKLFGQSPLVGQGTGSFKIGDEEAFIYPHNIFAELLSENGLVGFALFTTLLLVGFGSAIRILTMRPRRVLFSVDEWRYHKSCMVIMLAFLILYFGNAQTSFDISGNGGLWFFLTACYILALNVRKRVSQTVKSNSLIDTTPTPLQTAIVK